MAEKKQEEEENGVLLYYKYATVPDNPELVRFYESNCKSLALVGRVRLSSDGANVTVGGKISSLEKHIAAVKLCNLFRGTDFKLACSHCPSNDRIARECGFTALSIRVVKGEATEYVCELCWKHGKHVEKSKLPLKPLERSESPELESGTSSNHTAVLLELPPRHVTLPSRKLRILCLHGFRQNASNFRGRMASLAKKLKSSAEFVFVDGPHVLPFIYQQHRNRPNNYSNKSFSKQDSDFSDASLQLPPPSEKCKQRFAWLIAPNFNCSGETDWKMADKPFDPLQYQQQTEGFEESCTYLKSLFSQMGPFDGVLGFSQGAAMAAVLCAWQGKDSDLLDFRFVILCSGFPLALMDFGQGTINCPSLHIFGNGQGKDRQIAHRFSMELASLFNEGSSMVIEHESGHIIPTQSPYIDKIKDFLQRFL